METKEVRIDTLLPSLEISYNKRDAECYELVHDETKGYHTIAKRDIEPLEPILIEEPLYYQPLGCAPALLHRPDVVQLMDTIERSAASHSHLTGADMYPPEARRALDRFTELNVNHFASTSTQIDEIWKLHDAHRVAEVDYEVVVDGLVSQAGKLLNGKRGRVVNRDETDVDRLGVDIIGGGGTEGKARRSVRRANLKTLGGIMRTNAFVNEEDGKEYLFKILSRVNHACDNQANIAKFVSQGKAYVVAKKEIRAGDEILIDYIGGEREEDRLGLLQLKYNFSCPCPKHSIHD